MKRRIDARPAVVGLLVMLVITAVSAVVLLAHGTNSRGPADPWVPPSPLPSTYGPPEPEQYQRVPDPGIRPTVIWW